MHQTLPEFKTLVKSHLASVPAEVHQWFAELVSKVEGQETLKQQLSDAETLLKANGYTITAP